MDYKVYKIEDSICVIPSNGRLQVSKTINVGIGDVFTRKKGSGWQREVTAVLEIDAHPWCEYREHLNDGEGWHPNRTCSVHALRRWGSIDSKIDFDNRLLKYGRD